MKPETRCVLKDCYRRRKVGSHCAEHAGWVGRILSPPRRTGKNWPDKEIKFLDEPRPRDRRREQQQEERLVASVGRMLRQRGLDEVEIGWRLDMVRDRCRCGFDDVFQDGC